jgi:hypothetical protein
MLTREDAKTKGAMSMLGLLLFLSLAISFLLSPETLRNLLKLLVIALLMLAGLAAASTPHHVKMGVEKNGAI